MSLRPTLGLAVIAICLTACETTSQYTSGADYLERYPAQTSLTEYAPSASAAHITGHATTDAAIRNIAAVEPDLRFPARIGLARIDRHNLVGVPHDEGQPKL